MDCRVLWLSVETREETAVVQLPMMVAWASKSKEEECG